MDALKEARSLLLLQCLPGLGDRLIHHLLHRFGSGAEALAAPPAAFADVVGPEAERARWDLSVHRPAVNRALDWARRHGARVLPRTGDGYPASLLKLDDPPPVLFVQGDPSLLDRTMVTVVGSRRCTSYGRRVAADVATLLARQGIVVVSGLARGIDAAGHRATLEAGGATLAVLGTGLAVPYPRSNVGLFRRIGREGLLVSEFMPHTSAAAHHFPRRNRILAALPRRVVVVEAAQRSGALITARLALEWGRCDVVAVPGPIYSPLSEGTNELIRGAAGALVDAEGVLEGLDGFDLRVTPARRDPLVLAPEARALWFALGPQAEPVDALSRRAGVSSGEALAALSSLEMDGWARREPGMRFLRASA